MGRRHNFENGTVNDPSLDINATPHIESVCEMHRQLKKVKRLVAHLPEISDRRNLNLTVPVNHQPRIAPGGLSHGSQDGMFASASQQIEFRSTSRYFTDPKSFEDSGTDIAMMS